MSQTERPEPQVRGRVGDAAQAVLDCVDALIHKDVTHAYLKKKKTDETISSHWLYNIVHVKTIEHFVFQMFITFEDIYIKILPSDLSDGVRRNPYLFHADHCFQTPA